MKKEILEISTALWRSGIEITSDDMITLYNTGKGLHRLAELECGTSVGNNSVVLHIDEEAGRFYYQVYGPGFSREVPLKRNPYKIYENRLKKLAEKYPGLSFETQGDPRGYVLKAVVNGNEIGIF